MKNINFENSIAMDMDRALEENKPIFSNAAMIEKLAFKRVSDEDKPNELEVEVEAALTSTAAEECCKECCKCDGKESGKCSCHCDKTKKEASMQISKTAAMVNTLVSLSEQLEAEGFERLAAVSLMMADKLIVEAKAKKSKSKSKSKADSKSKSSKKDQAKKMREAKEKKEKASKSKSSAKKTAQRHPWEQNIRPTTPSKNYRDVIMASLQPAVAATIAKLDVVLDDVQVTFKPGQASDQAFNAIMTTVNQLQRAAKLPANMKVHQVG